MNLKKFLLFLFFIGISFSCFANTNLTFIHTNDLHAHLLPNNESGQDCVSGKDCLGGFARLQSFIDNERTKNPDLLYFDSGDRFSGTFFYTFHKEKDLIDFFNRLKPDAMTLGNHEFDDEKEILENFLNKVKTPCVVSNVDFPKSLTLKKTVLPSFILQKNGIKIGIIGALPEDLPTTSMHADTALIKPVLPSIKEQIESFKNQGISVIVLLSHLGIDKEKILAEELDDIDIIFGAHTHTFLSNTSAKSQGKYPIVIEHSNKTKTLIVSTGCFGQYVGKLNVVFDDEGKVESFLGDTIPLSEAIPEDKEVSDRILNASKDIEKRLNQKLKSISVSLSMTNGKDYCTEECPIGQALTKMLLLQIPEADVVLINSGAIRSGLEKGDVFIKNIIQVLPFDSTAVLTEMTEKMLKDYIEQGLRKYHDDERVNPLLQISGASYKFNPVSKKIEFFKIDKKNILPNGRYKVVLPLFLAKGGDGFTPLTSYKILQKSMIEYVQEYMEKYSYRPDSVFGVLKSLSNLENLNQ